MGDRVKLGRQITTSEEELDEVLEDDSFFEEEVDHADEDTYTDEPESTGKSDKNKWILLPMFFIISFVSALSILDSNFSSSDSNDSAPNVAGENTDSVNVDSSDNLLADEVTLQERNTVSGQGSRTFSLNPSNRIAYVAGGNVWVMNEDGTGKAKITNDGNVFSSYKNVDWKSTGEVTYSKCAGGQCAVFAFNVNTDFESVLLNLQSPMINNITWSPDGQNMYVNYVKPNGSLEAIKFDASSKVVTVIKQYLPNKGAIYEHGDQIGFEFSSNGEYVAVVNTLVNPEEDNITVYNRDGQQITVISGDTNLPEFAGDSSIYFNSDNSLYKGKIGSIQSSPVVEPFNAIDMDISPDDRHLVYWELREGNVPVTVYRNLVTGESKDIQGYFKVVQWINESTILGFQVENYQSVHQYDIQRMAVVDLNQNLNILEENNVTEFSVSGY